MASPATEIDAGGEPVRVTNPDRVIYPATDRTAEVTKRQVVEYYVAVGEGIMRALGDRPTALERWTSGVHEGIRLATGRGDKSDAFYSKRVPKGAPEYVETAQVMFPSGRTAVEVCVANLATVAWCAQMGTITFHPWATRSGDNDHPDELRIDLDPQPGTGFRDAVRVAGVARELLEEHGLTGYPKTSGNRGVHIYLRIEPRWDFVDVRHAAIGFGRELERRDPGVTMAWWKEERGARIFVDFNQNSRDRTIASAYSLRPLPGAPVSTPVSWEELAELDDPRAFTLFTVPERLASGGDPMAGIDEVAHDLTPLLRLYEESGLGEAPYPPDYPKMPGEPPRVQPSKKVAAHWDEKGERIP
jgi:DNA ligase D-like protein (predicted polymerase)